MQAVFLYHDLRSPSRSRKFSTKHPCQHSQRSFLESVRTFYWSDTPCLVGAVRCSRGNVAQATLPLMQLCRCGGGWPHLPSEARAGMGRPTEKSRFNPLHSLCRAVLRAGRGGQDPRDETAPPHSYFHAPQWCGSSGMPLLSPQNRLIMPLDYMRQSSTLPYIH